MNWSKLWKVPSVHFTSVNKACLPMGIISVYVVITKMSRSTINHPGKILRQRVKICYTDVVAVCSRVRSCRNSCNIFTHLYLVTGTQVHVYLMSLAEVHIDSSKTTVKRNKM